MKTHQKSFGGGEISKEMFGRFDLAHFTNGLAKCRNYEVRPHGPISKRPGFEMIKETESGGVNPVRIIPFIFSATQALVLELGDLYVRFISEGAPVIETGVVISGATAANPVVITATAHGYADGDEVYIAGVVGMTQINGRYFKVAGQTANTFNLTDLQDNNIDGSAYTAYSSAGTSSRVYKITSPWGHADLFDLHFKQSEDIITVAHPDYDTREITRLGATNWTITTITFGPTIAAPTNQQVTLISASGTDENAYCVTAVAVDTLEESLPSSGPAIVSISKANPASINALSHGKTTGDAVLLMDVEGMEEVNGRIFLITVTDTNNFTLDGENSTGYNTHTANTGIIRAGATNDLSVAGNFNDISWNVVTDAVRYNIYKIDQGLWGYIGQTTALVFRDDNITPNLLLSPPEDSQPFNVADDRPAEVAYAHQRRIFSGTTNKPATTWMTRSGTESNLSKTIPSQDDDAIIFRLKSGQYNGIKHIVALDNILIFTDADEWVISRGPLEALTPETIRDRLRPQSSEGSSNLSPLVTGDSILFEAKNGAHIMEMSYSFESGESGGYKPRDISILAPHLFDGYTTKDWAATKNPDPIIWGCRSDGILRGLTFVPGQKPDILAYHRHDTYRGEFESCCSVPESNGEQMLYCVIKRVINGVTRRYIERRKSRQFTNGYKDANGDESFRIEDSFYVDSGLSWDNPLTITGVTAANPPVVTSVAHGLSNGDRVRITDVDSGTNSDGTAWGMSELNDISFKVASVAANTFELQSDLDTPVDIDGSDYTAWVSGGVARQKISTVGGLWHLIGETVDILGDGSVLTKQVVDADGQINILDGNGNPLYYSLIHIGLGYDAEAKTLPLYMNTREIDGFGAGRLNDISKVYIRTDKTAGFKAGPRLARLTQYSIRTNENWDQPTGLVSGEVEFGIAAEWDTEGQIWITQCDPLPCTVLSMALEVEVSD